MINTLSVALTILFGLLLVYALVMMIVPQLITSVTALYYTAQANITKFMNWANHLEFIDKNEQITELLNSSLRCSEHQSGHMEHMAQEHPAALHAEHPERRSHWCAERGDGGQNLIIGIIVAVYMLASRKRFVQQGKLVLHSIVRPRWAQLITEEVEYATGCSAVSSTARSWTLPSSACCAISAA